MIAALFVYEHWAQLTFVSQSESLQCIKSNRSAQDAAARFRHLPVQIDVL